MQDPQLPWSTSPSPAFSQNTRAHIFTRKLGAHWAACARQEEGGPGHSHPSRAAFWTPVGL